MSLNKRWKELRNTANTENVLMTVSEIIKFYKEEELILIQHIREIIGGVMNKRQSSLNH